MANMKDALCLTMFAIRLVAVLVTMEARTPWVVPGAAIQLWGTA